MSSSVLQNQRYVSLGTCSKVIATSYASIFVRLLGTLIYEAVKLERAKKIGLNQSVIHIHPFPHSLASLPI
jgi:hypothetical protein